MNSNKALELAKSTYPHNENLRVAYMLGIDKGYEFCREQMLKEAVEADVNTYKNLEEGTSWAEFVVEMPTNKLGDKVSIIIVKGGK